MPDPLDDFDMSLSPMSLGQPDLLDTHLGPSPPVQDDFAQMFSDAVGGNSVPDILFAMAPAVDDAAAEVFCRQLGGYLHLVAQWGWCELQVIFRDFASCMHEAQNCIQCPCLKLLHAEHYVYRKQYGVPS